MESSVQLQPPFSFAIWPIMVTGLVLALFLVAAAVLIYIKSRKENPKPEEEKDKDKTYQEILGIKKKYSEQLLNIEQGLNSGDMSIRDSYQNMSVCIREFAYEMTGIKVQNYTLQEIQMLGLPMLEQLIAEYYSPEFEEKSIGDARASLYKTRMVIERWM